MTEHARWKRPVPPNSTVSRYLVGDNGAVLAVIRPVRDRGQLVGYTWDVADQAGTTDTLYKAMRRVRKALRECQ